MAQRSANSCSHHINLTKEGFFFAFVAEQKEAIMEFFT